MDELNNSDIIKEHSFVVSQIIGTGTFGRVILARQRYTQDHFAVKVLRICDICRLNQVEHIRSEKEILIENKHPFIVDLFWTSHDSTYLYMCLEFLPGGELFSYLRSRGHFENSVAQFYACEIILALEFLHYKHIIYRDLKPENLLLDLDGHVKLTDFGFAKKLEDSRTWTLCGTPEYIAPEVIQGKGHNKAVDWWSLGILLYEMLVGYPPFYDATPYGIYDKIVRGRIEWPQHRINKIAKDLIRKLLVQDRTRRLGNMKKGADDIKNHKWFQGVEWNHVYLKSEEPPIKPQVSHNGDSRNFEQYSDDGSLLFYESHSPPLTPEQKNLFNDF